MRLVTLLSILPLIFLFYACPVGLNYSLADGHLDSVNNDLIGLWESDAPTGEIRTLEISAHTETSLKAKVKMAGDSYALECMEGIIWQTRIDGKHFLVFKPDCEALYYHYCYEFNGDEIKFHDVSLLDGGTDAVTSTEALRRQVQNSISKDGWGAEITTLTRQ